MNEVTKIHLGNLAFTIAVDAHHELRAYLDEIKKQVEDKEVMDEIEVRMAELLVEHGLDSQKVVLPADVDFLKEQLGSPSDFTEDTTGSAAEPSQTPENRKLFRDPNGAIFAGVASGLAKYLGVDPLLIRILFIVLTFVTAGWGILIYILLTLLVPEAKTTSERLMMAGKPVNVGSLQEIVERSGVKGAAKRANATFAGPINRLFNLAVKLVGLFFVFFGLSLILGLITATAYWLLHTGNWLQNNIFPIGLSQHLAVYLAMFVISLIALLTILVGASIFRRKWPVPMWLTGTLLGLLFIGMAVGGVLSADIYPSVRDKYNANLHSSFISTQPFSADAVYGNIDINYQVSGSYYVGFTYYDHPNLGAIKTTVKNGDLVIDASSFNPVRNCASLCFPRTYRLSVTIYSPNVLDLINQSGMPKPFPIPAPPAIFKP